ELFVCGDDHVHSEGYRLLWYRSTRKAEQDKSRRARTIQKATEALSDLRERLQGPRTRFRTRSKVEQALAEILAEAEASSWLLVEIEGTGGRDVPPGNTGPTERANPVSEGDTIAFHTDVEAEPGVSLGSGARGWRIPSVDE